MKSVFRSTRIIILIFSAVLVTSGCAKLPHPAESAAQPPVAESAPPQRDLTPEEMKKIVAAKVNGVELSMNEVVNMMNAISASSPPDSTTPPEEIRKAALDQVILRELILQDATRKGLKVEERVLSQTMNKLITSYGHEEGFKQFLEQQHATEDEVRKEVEKRLLVLQIFRSEVFAKSEVSEDDVRKEYELRKEVLKAPYEEAKDSLARELKAAAQTKRRLEWEEELRKNAKIELVGPEVGNPQPAAENSAAK